MFYGSCGAAINMYGLWPYIKNRCFNLPRRIVAPEELHIYSDGLGPSINTTHLLQISMKMQLIHAGDGGRVRSRGRGRYAGDDARGHANENAALHVYEYAE